MDEMSPEMKAYKQVKQALSQGQAAVDALPPEVREKALEVAGDTVKDVVDRSEMEGYTPVPGMTPQGLTDEARALITEDTLKAKESEDLERMKAMIEAEQRLRSKM
tara:strand:+ start:4626 stop:4943 length:318 start_codon:yes stop_codon:yes gene_type:complete